jgi:hypothetical protein
MTAGANLIGQMLVPNSPVHLPDVAVALNWTFRLDIGNNYSLRNTCDADTQPVHVSAAIASATIQCPQDVDLEKPGYGTLTRQLERSVGNRSQLSQ